MEYNTRATDHPTDLERTNLEAHVELDHQRHSQIDLRLDKIDVRMCTMHKDILEGQKSTTKVLISTAGTVLAGLISTIVVILIAFL